MRKCKYCKTELNNKDWAMPAKGKDQYACLNCSDKALKELSKKR